MAVVSPPVRQMNRPRLVPTQYSPGFRSRIFRISRPSAEKTLTKGEGGGIDQQDLAVPGRRKQLAVLGDADVREPAGEGNRFEGVLAFVVGVKGSVAQDDPQGVGGVDDDAGRVAPVEGVFLDGFGFLDEAEDLFAGEPYAALEVGGEVEDGHPAEPADVVRLAGERIVIAYAVRGAEPEHPVLVFFQVHTRQMRQVGVHRSSWAAEVIAVEAGKAVARADPDESETVLIAAEDGVGGESFVCGVMLEIVIGSRLDGPAEEAGEQEKEGMGVFHRMHLLSACKLGIIFQNG